MTQCPFCENPIPDEVVKEMAEELGMMEADGFYCGASLDGGGVCSRSVDAPGDTCFQHD